MFVKPNEFEAQLAAANAPAPVYKKSHRAAGIVFLAVAVPILAAWWVILACWALGTAILRAPLALARLVRDAADYSGWLIAR